jgi:hypothetical protein
MEGFSAVMTVANSKTNRPVVTAIIYHSADGKARVFVGGTGFSLWLFNVNRLESGPLHGKTPRRLSRRGVYWALVRFGFYETLFNSRFNRSKYESKVTKPLVP